MPTTDSAATKLGFSEWPFRVVADRAFGSIWADRTALKQELVRRLERLAVVSHSTVQLVWADFGAGKTHALRYLQHLASLRKGDDIQTAYCETPVAVSGFGDLYRQLIKSISDDQLKGLARAIPAVSPVGSAAMDTIQAVRLLDSGDHGSARIARAWLANEKSFPAARDLRSYGITGRIETDERAIEVVATIVKLINSSGKSLVWMIDEYQRTAGIQSTRREILGRSLVTLFNECSNGLHVVISCSVAQQATAGGLVPPDLRSRANTFPMLALPQMTAEDCVTFCRDLFAAFRSEDVDPSYPFDDRALEHAVKLFVETSSSLTPRNLMQAIEELLFSALEEPGQVLPLTHDAIAALWNKRTISESS